jgi:HEAT repeat protein
MNASIFEAPGKCPKRHLALVVFGLAVFVLPMLASAEGGSVRYSYETAEIADKREGVLVPIPSSDLEGKVDKGQLEEAFDELKSDKSATYGSSNIRVIGAGTDQQRVEIRIDDDKKKYDLIIKAETVYTLTELGVERVFFPQYQNKGLTRADIPFSAYSLNVPLWRAFPIDRSIRPSMVLMPDGQLTPSDDVYKRWQNGSEQLQTKVLSYLKNDEAYVVVSLLGKLPSMDVEYVDDVLPLLEHEKSQVRKAALKSLEPERDQKRVLEAAVALMRAEEGSKLAKKASMFLANSEKPAFAIHRQYFLLKHGTKKQVLKALDRLAKQKQTPETLEFVYARLTANKSKIRKAAAETLEALDADEKQIAALSDKQLKGDVKTQIAKRLAEDEEVESQIAGHKYRATENKNYKAVRAIESLRSIGTKSARNVIESFADSKADIKRQAAAKALVKLGQADSVTPLVKAYEKRDDSALKQAVVRLLDKQDLETVLEFIESDYLLVRVNAYGALGEFVQRREDSKDKIFKALKKGIESSEPRIRSASVGSLGAFQNDKALKLVKKLKGDANPAVRAGVADALGSYSKDVLKETLYGYVDGTAPAPKAAALEALGQRGDASMWSKMMKLAETSEGQVRASALRAIGQLVTDNKETRGNVISVLSGAMSSNNPEVQLAALEQLGRFKNEKAVTSIAIKLGSDKRRVKLAAIEALGKTGHDRAAEVLSGSLKAQDPEIREAAVRALGLIGGKKVEKILLERLENEKDQDLVRLIKETLETV